MVQAASSGLIDFTRMEYTGAWQRRLRLLLRGLYRDNKIRLMEAQHRHHSALVTAAGSISPDSLEKVQTRCQDDLYALQNMLIPWDAATKEEREKDQVKGHRNRWQNRWGDLNSEETKKKIADTARALESMREINQPTSSVADSWMEVYNRKTSQAIEGIREVKHGRTSRN